MIRLLNDPASTTSRPVILFVLAAKIPVECVHVNIFAGEQFEPGFRKLNPNGAVPVLDHDGFILTECAAILKYLADLTDHPAYPKDLRQRARVHERMDWFMTFFMSDFCYGLCYPQILPDYRLSEPGFSEALARHKERAERRLAVLDQWIGPNTYVCGPTLTLADYLGACLVTLGELIDFDLTPWPNVKRWIATMKSQPAWDETHAAFYGWRSAIQAQKAQLAQKDQSRLSA